eukprot:s1630_g8.t1
MAPLWRCGTKISPPGPVTSFDRKGREPMTTRSRNCNLGFTAVLCFTVLLNRLSAAHAFHSRPSLLETAQKPGLGNCPLFMPAEFARTLGIGGNGGRCACEHTDRNCRSPLSVKSSADLLHLLRAGDGSGIVVDEELAQCYPGVLDDIQSLVSSKAIRSVRPQKEEKSRRPTRRSSASVIATQAAATAERHLLGDVLFSCFEPEVEALQVDADLREAFHATRRPTQGDVAARIAVKAQEAPTKRARRASQKPRKVQNAHIKRQAFKQLDVFCNVRRGIPPNRIFLVGYSQGGGLALAAALRAPRRLGGVLMLSSWVAEPLPDDFKDVPVHIFHGAEDPVVPLSTAQMGRVRLEAAGLRTTFRAYAGMTHGVCDEEVADLAQTFYESLL